MADDYSSCFRLADDDSEYGVYSNNEGKLEIGHIASVEYTDGSETTTTYYGSVQSAIDGIYADTGSQTSYTINMLANDTPRQTLNFSDPSKVITLDLNGHTLSGRAIKHWGGSLCAPTVYLNYSTSGTVMLTVKDSSDNKTGQISDGYSAIANMGYFKLEGGNICNNSYGEDVQMPKEVSQLGLTLSASVTSVGRFDMTGGKIYNNSSYAISGGVVNGKVAAMGILGTFNMSAGDISTNSYLDESATVNGGAVVNEGTFTLTGGTIGGKDASFANTATNGAGIYNTGTANLYGGQIINNRATTEGGGVYFAGGTVNVGKTIIVANNAVVAQESETIDNVYVADGQLLSFDSNNLPDATTMNVGITMPDAGDFLTTDVSTNYVKCFESDNEDNTVLFYEGSVAGTYNYKLGGVCTVDFDGIETGFASITAASDAIAAYSGSQTSFVIKMQTSYQPKTAQKVQVGDKPVTIDLNGCEIDGTSVSIDYSTINFVACTSATITDTSASADGKITNSLSAIYNYGGNLTLAGGYISGNKGPQEEGTYTEYNYGAGVYTDNGGTTTLDGATISDNEGYKGAGVYTVDSTFIMKSGTIADNSSRKQGGAVYSEDSTFTMTGGTISGNTAVTGGAIYALQNDGISSVTISGGTIGGANATDGNSATDKSGAYGDG